MKKIIVPVLAFTLLLSGCWDIVESEKLGLITLIGVDIANDNQIKLVVQELSRQTQSVSGQQGGIPVKTPVKMHEAVAPTISEAIEKINSTNYHRTYTAHASAIILSEELASTKGVKPIIDYFERTPEIRRNTWLLISTKGQFERIFSSSINVEAANDIGKVIKGIIENKTRVSFIAANTLGDFLNLIWETGSEPYTSGISLIEANTSQVNLTAGSGSSGGKDFDISIENTAIFKKYKLAGWLNNEESKGLLWALGEVKGGSVPIYYDEKEVLMNIVRMNSDIKPLKSDGKIQMNIHVEVLANIEENQAKLVYADKQVVDRIQELLSEEIKKQILAALNKSRQLDTDVFGFGNYIFGSYPKEWKNIEKNEYDYYRSLTVNIDVKSTLNQLGLVKENQSY